MTDELVPLMNGASLGGPCVSVPASFRPKPVEFDMFPESLLFQRTGTEFEMVRADAFEQCSSKIYGKVFAKVCFQRVRGPAWFSTVYQNTRGPPTQCFELR